LPFPVRFVTNSGIAVFLSAMEFAARKHRRQRRKDPEATLPFINHPIIVTEFNDLPDRCYAVGSGLKTKLRPTSNPAHSWKSKLP